MTLLTRMVEAKRSPAVLRLKLVTIGARFPDHRILIFEGVDDVGVYQEWIRRFRDSEWYRPLPGAGKKQLLELLRQLREEGSPLLEHVRFFVDHDYDGVSKADVCRYLFVTDRYSIENYLCDRRVIDEILVDELRCAGDVGSLDTALNAFDAFWGALLEQLIEPCAIYRAGVLRRLRVSKKPGKLNGAISIELREVKSAISWSDVVQFDPPPSQTDVTASAGVIRSGGGFQHRGKWLLGAVRAWMALIYADRRSDQPKLFPTTVAELGPSPDQISLRSLAARSSVPSGLEEFLVAWS